MLLYDEVCDTWNPNRVYMGAVEFRVSTRWTLHALSWALGPLDKINHNKIISNNIV